MKSMTKKRVCVVTFLMFLTVASNAFAVRGPSGVSNTVHNLSMTADPALYTTAYISRNEPEVCIFCHTPHGGNNTGPLWNRNNPLATGFTTYDSATMSAAAGGVSTINSESLLCLSCHDGSISVNELMNYSTVDPIISDSNGLTDKRIVGIPGGSARIGGGPTDWFATTDLSDDHPISFSYDAVLLEYSSTPKAGSLKAVGTAEGLGVQFFTGGNRVECSSCHDPHVDYEANFAYYPFLITPNDGSKLCFACHNK